MKVDLDLPNYATKSDLKNPAGTDMSQCAGKRFSQRKIRS